MSKHEPQLGELITEEHPLRDAVHIAVAPVKAKDHMTPGAALRFVEGSTEEVEHGGLWENCIGIVDPFLSKAVKPGDRFWMYMKPRSITGLRHDWNHPAFPVTNPAVAADVAVAQEWVRSFASRWSYSFDEFMAGAREYVLKNYEMDDKWAQLDVPEADWAMFWECFHTLTGMSIGSKEKEFVRCCP